jgi:hypothetical protein
MVAIKESAAVAVKRVKETAIEARTGVKKAGGQARAEVIKLAERITGRARQRTKKRVVAIATGIAAVAAAAIAAVQLRGRRKRHWL